MNAVAVIPARGGSKGLPRKNLAEVGGASLLAWAAAATVDVKGLLGTWVSSEDPEILETVERAGWPGVHALVRPASLAQDHTPDLPVAQDALSALEATLTALPDADALWDEDIVVWLRPTAPFRRAADLQEILNFLEAHPEVDSVRSVLPVREHPAKVYRVVGALHGTPWLAPWSPAEHAANYPRQTLPPAWRACGWIDAVRVGVVRADSMEGRLIAARPVPEPWEDRGQEIDTDEDLFRARAIAQGRHWRPGRCP